MRCKDESTPIARIYKKVIKKATTAFFKSTKSVQSLNLVALQNVESPIYDLMRKTTCKHLWLGMFSVLLLTLFGTRALAEVQEKEFETFINQVETLKKDDLVKAFDLVNEYQNSKELSDDQQLQLLLFKVKASIRDQFNFNYPKLLREYLLEAKYLNNQKHIYIAQRMLFIFHIFNQSGKTAWLRRGLRYFEEQQDTSQIAQTYF